MFFSGYNVIVRKRRKQSVVVPEYQCFCCTMAVESCGKCAKYLFIIFNFLFWITGSAVLSVGIWIRVDPTIEYYFEKFDDLAISLDYLYTAAHILIGVGAFVFLVGFCGCLGAVRESTRFLAVYIACMVLIMAAELGAGIYVAVKKDEIAEKLKNELTTAVRSYNRSQNSSMSFLQIKFSCCGAVNYTDYFATDWYKTNSPTGLHVPGSCCVLNDTDRLHPKPINTIKCMEEARLRADKPFYMYQEGCYEKILDFINQNSLVLIGLGIGIAVVEAFGIIFALCLCRQIPAYKDEWRGKD